MGFARLTLAACLAASSLLSAQSASQALADRIDRILGASQAQRASWAIHVVDLSDGHEVYARSAQVPMTPASNTKLFSTALALQRLGAGHCFETTVTAEARPAADGRLRGDLKLVGGGDPSLSGRYYPYRKGPGEGDAWAPLADLADQVVAAGVKVIEGDVVGDDSRWLYDPYPEGWSVGDLAWEYGAGVSALVWNDGVMKLTVRPSKQSGAGSIVTFEPALEYYTVHNTVQVSDGMARHVELDRLPGSHTLELHGSLRPGNGATTQWIAADDPALFAATAFAQLLRSKGVVIRGSVRAAHRRQRLAGQGSALGPQTEVLARRLSPPLSDLVTVVNKVSQNLHAEMLLREVGLRMKGEGTADAGQQEMSAWLKSLGAEDRGSALEDGSGLSRKTLLSAATITTLLRAMYDSELRDTFWLSLPIAGEDGTLSSRFRGARAADRIRAKTGSVSHVAALSGYAGLDPSRRLAFSILVNGFTAPSGEIRDLIDKIAVAIEEEGRR